MYTPIKVTLLIYALLALPVLTEADTLRKLSEVKRGKISKLSIAGLNFGRSGLFVTAVRDGDANLRVLVWANDETEPRAVITAGTIKEVAVAALSGKRFVTAVRDGNDRLRAIAWQASEDGRSIERLGTAIGPRIHKIAAAAGGAGDDVWVTIAARRLDGNLIVSHYAVVGNSINLKESETYGKVGTISISAGTTSAVAMRDGASKLRLIHFWHPLFRGGMATGGDISDVRISNNGTGSSGEWFTFSSGEGPTGVRTGSGCRHRRLIDHGLGKIIGWKLEDTSLQADFIRTREEQLTGTGGIVKKADLVYLDDAARAFLVTGRLTFGSFCRLLPRDQGKPLLRLTVWDTRDRDEAFIRVAGAELGGDYTDIDITEIAASGNQPRFAVALRGVRGKLKVTVWGISP